MTILTNEMSVKIADHRKVVSPESPFALKADDFVRRRFCIITYIYTVVHVIYEVNRKKTKVMKLTILSRKYIV